MKQKNIIVTGGAGFIGSNLIKYLINNTNNKIISVDKLTYAGNFSSLLHVAEDDRYVFEQVDICDDREIRRVISQYKPDYIMNLAAESHVDRSIDGPGTFIQTNIVGTYTLLNAALEYYMQLDENKREGFRFLHVSTDEVFGSLGKDGYFTETTPYDPKSPYSASKASPDHLVRAWKNTYGLPIIITNCSNNYGPFQYPEKLIPVTILNALKGNKIPIYGKGDNIRDWLHVEDHVRALLLVLENGNVGETYNIGGKNEKTNLDIVKKICSILDNYRPLLAGNYNNLIEFVQDRPGHDKRYAIDSSKIENELNFKPAYNFDEGIERTILWYLKNMDWCENVLENKYNLERLGKTV